MSNMGVSKKLKDILNNITDESQYASSKKAEELGFDVNKGIIPLSEAYYNLNEIRDLLKDAIQRGKVDLMPISLQENIANTLTDVITKIANLTNGVDEIVNIVNQIEVVYSDLYTIGMYQFSENYVGFETKANQLKILTQDAVKLAATLKEGLKQKSALEDLVNVALEKNNHLSNLLGESELKAHSVGEALTKSSETHTQISSIYSEISGTEKIIKELLAEARSSDSSIKTVEVEGNKFFEEINKYKETIRTVSDNAKNTVEENKIEVENLVKELKALEDQIKDKIQKATGYSLFNSFQIRKEEIRGNKKNWLIYIAVLIVVTIGLTIYIAQSHVQFDVAFYLKISISIPLIFAISFCTIQYSRERKLEEEYAFKSNISISLVPYKELIEKLSGSSEQQERFTNFMIDSIEKVFTSPTGKAFESESKLGDTEDAAKKLASIMESLMKPIEPIVKVLGKK